MSFFQAAALLLGLAGVMALWRIVDQNQRVVRSIDALGTDIAALRQEVATEIRNVKEEVEAISATLSSPKTDGETA